MYKPKYNLIIYFPSLELGVSPDPLPLPTHVHVLSQKEKKKTAQKSRITSRSSVG